MRQTMQWKGTSGNCQNKINVRMNIVQLLNQVVLMHVDLILSKNDTNRLERRR